MVLGKKAVFMYRGFYKNLNNLSGKSISSADLRIQSMTIKKDLLTSVTSNFTVIQIPTAFTEGNLFGVYDDYGQTVYVGIIKSLEGEDIECEDILSLFNDEWRYNNPTGTTIENKLKSIIANDLGKSSDKYQADIFSSFTITETSATANNLETIDGTTNLMDYLFSIYTNFGIMLDISASFGESAPTIKIGKPNYTTIKLSNNNNALRNFDITRETQETNKLIVYNADGTELRKTYYATASGITENSESLDRLARIKTKIVFSDDELSDIVANNLTEEMYNHQITVDLVLQNKLYDFDNFHLGQTFEIYYNENIYESVLTGYSITVDDGGKADKIALTFGKVRVTLESKIQQIASETYSKSLQQPSAEPTVFPSWLKIWGGVCRSGSSITLTIPTEVKSVLFYWKIGDYWSDLVLPRGAGGKHIVSDESNYAGGNISYNGTTLTYNGTAANNTNCYLGEVWTKES